MGCSCTLLQKDFIELSLEIDRGISLEMSTGFGGRDRVTTHTNIPLTLEELQQVIDRLTEYKDKLSKAWKCPDCGTLNPEDEPHCGTCDRALADKTIDISKIKIGMTREEVKSVLGEPTDTSVLTNNRIDIFIYGGKGGSDESHYELAFEPWKEGKLWYVMKMPEHIVLMGGSR